METAEVEFGVIPFMAEIGRDDAAFAKAAPEGFPQTCRDTEPHPAASAPVDYDCDFIGPDGVQYVVSYGLVAEKDAALSASAPGPLGLKRGATIRDVEQRLRRAGAVPTRYVNDDGTESLLASLCETDDMADFKVSFDRQGGARAVRLRVTIV